MKITDLLSTEAIELHAEAADKKDILQKAVDLMCKTGNITDREQYLAAVYAREEEGTTGVGEGIAIPHGRCDGVSKPGLIAMVIPKGVDYEALDDEPVHLLFLIAANPQSGSAHIDILSKLSGMLMHEEFTDALKNAKTPEEFLKVIDDAEEEKDSASQAKTEDSVSAPKENQTKLLAVLPVSPIHLWQQKPSKKVQKHMGVLLRWRPEVPVVLKMY